MLSSLEPVIDTWFKPINQESFLKFKLRVIETMVTANTV